MQRLLLMVVILLCVCSGAQAQEVPNARGGTLHFIDRYHNGNFTSDIEREAADIRSMQSIWWGRHVDLTAGIPKNYGSDEGERSLSHLSWTSMHVTKRSNGNASSGAATKLLYDRLIEEVGESAFIHDKDGFRVAVFGTHFGGIEGGNHANRACNLVMPGRTTRYGVCNNNPFRFDPCIDDRECGQATFGECRLIAQPRTWLGVRCANDGGCNAGTEKCETHQCERRRFHGPCATLNTGPSLCVVGNEHACCTGPGAGPTCGVCEGDGLTICDNIGSDDDTADPGPGGVADCVGFSSGHNGCSAGNGILNAEACDACEFSIEQSDPAVLAILQDYSVDIVDGTREDFASWEVSGYSGECEVTATDGHVDNYETQGGIGWYPSWQNDGPNDGTGSDTRGRNCGNDGNRNVCSFDGVTACNLDTECAGPLNVCENATCDPGTGSGHGIMCVGLGGTDTVNFGVMNGIYHDNQGTNNNAFIFPSADANGQHAGHCRAVTNAQYLVSCTTDAQCTDRCVHDAYGLRATAVPYDFNVNGVDSGAVMTVDTMIDWRKIALDGIADALHAYDPDKEFIWNGAMHHADRAELERSMDILDNTSVDGAAVEDFIVWGGGALDKDDFDRALELHQRLQNNGQWLNGHCGVGPFYGKESTGTGRLPRRSISRMCGAAVLLTCYRDNMANCVVNPWDELGRAIADQTADGTLTCSVDADCPPKDRTFGFCSNESTRHCDNNTHCSGSGVCQIVGCGDEIPGHCPAKYPELDVNIGLPTMNRVCSDDVNNYCWDDADCAAGQCVGENFMIVNDVYVRTYTKGLVLINPTGSLGGAGKDVSLAAIDPALEGHTYTTADGKNPDLGNDGDIDVHPQQAMILVDNNPGAIEEDCNDPAQGFCGDGCLDTEGGHSETCDGDGVGGGGETASCDIDCTTASCGDSTLNTTAGEECDDGNASDLDGCLQSCANASCGDGFLRASSAEECDDGNKINGDGCQANCLLPPSTATDARRTAPSRWWWSAGTAKP
jgi:cysteine-rich repeat protein